MSFLSKVKTFFGGLEVTSAKNLNAQLAAANAYAKKVEAAGIRDLDAFKTSAQAKAKLDIAKGKAALATAVKDAAPEVQSVVSALVADLEKNILADLA